MHMPGADDEPTALTPEARAMHFRDAIAAGLDDLEQGRAIAVEGDRLESYITELGERLSGQARRTG